MRVHRWHARILAAAAALALLASACGDGDDGGDQGGGDAQGGLTIGVSLASPTIPLYVAMSEGIRDRAGEFEDVEIVFTEANEDPVQQLNDVQDLIAQGVDGILISPIDAEAAKPAYEDARAAGITIMSIARNTDPELEDSFIGAPWDRFGREIAEWTCGESEGGKVAMIKGPAGASFVEDMEDGYKEVVSSEACSGMEIVFEVNAVPLTADQGLAAAQDALSADEDLAVIYANNDDLAAGAIQALEERGIDMESVIVTGFDGTPEGLDLIEEGKLDMTIALRPYHWGILGVETIVSQLRGEEVPSLVEIEVEQVTSENIEELDREDLR
jgi:ribose transport system substrate-binding protein